MALPLESKQYYLGIEGSQSGPFNEKEIETFIYEKKVNEETLVWFEGIETWQKLIDLEPFRSLIVSSHEEREVTSPLIMPSNESPAIHIDKIEITDQIEAVPKLKPQPKASKTPTNEEATKTVQQPKIEFIPEVPLEPVYQIKPLRVSSVNFKTVLAGGILVGCITGGTYFLMPGIFSSGQENPQPFPSTTPKPKVDPDAQARALAAARTAEYESATGEFLLNAEKGIAIFKKLLRDNSNDEIAKKIIPQLSSYYEKRDPKILGSLFLEIQRPELAIPQFEKPPISYNELYKANEAAYQKTKEPKEAEQYLSEMVRILFGPLNDYSLAMNKLDELKKLSPGSAKKYSYYFKSSEEKIRLVFERVSINYLNSFRETFIEEFPEIQLKGKPEVSVKKIKDKSYRIVAEYRGDIELKRDQLRNIGFVFYRTEDGWLLVETNLTRERSKWALEQKKKLENKVTAENILLLELEGAFRNLYPQKAFYELIQ